MSKQKNEETVKMIEDVAKHDIESFIKGYNELPKIVEGMKQVENSILLKMKSHNIDELSKVKIEMIGTPKVLPLNEIQKIVASDTLLDMILVDINIDETVKYLRKSGYSDTVIIPFINKLKGELMSSKERLVVKK